MIRRTLLTALACCLPFAAPAQDKKPEKPEKAPARIEKLAEWPKLSDSDRDRVLALLAQFRKDERFHQGARDGLIAIGDAATPLLFQQVSDRAENVNEQVFSVFDKVLGPQHAALLARESKNSRLALRRYVALRLCRLVDAEVLPVLESMAKDKDAEIVFHANLGLLALAQKEALAEVLEHVRSNWNECRTLIAEVLPAGRSRAAGQWVLDAAAKAQPVEQMNALRLLRYLGTKDHTLAIKGYLTAEDSNVKKEAVNALRCIHGEAPVENLSVFQVIEMAKKWQGK